MRERKRDIPSRNRVSEHEHEHRQAASAVAAASSSIRCHETRKSPVCGQCARRSRGVCSPILSFCLVSSRPVPSQPVPILPRLASPRLASPLASSHLVSDRASCFSRPGSRTRRVVEPHRAPVPPFAFLVPRPVLRLAVRIINHTGVSCSTVRTSCVALRFGNKRVDLPRIDRVTCNVERCVYLLLRVLCDR